MDEVTALKKGRHQVLRLLTYRARSKKEVADYLERKGYTNEVIESLLKEMSDYGYVDDRKFAAEYVNYRKLRGYGLKSVCYELITKGIDKEIIDSEIANNFDQDDDILMIRAILKKRSPVNGQFDHRWFNRQVAFLKRRGFQDSLIITALKEYKEYNFFD